MSNRVTMGQDDSMMLQRDTLPMQVLNKLMDWIMDGKLKMGEKSLPVSLELVVCQSERL